MCSSHLPCHHEESVTLIIVPAFTQQHPVTVSLLFSLLHSQPPISIIHSFIVTRHLRPAKRRLPCHTLCRTIHRPPDSPPLSPKILFLFPPSAFTNTEPDIANTRDLTCDRASRAPVLHNHTRSSPTTSHDVHTLRQQSFPLRQQCVSF